MIHHPLDFDDMVLLVSISKTKSLTKTSQELDIAIGNIRKRIAKMEDYFGQPIYTRKSTGIALTRLGEELSAFYDEFLGKFSFLKNNFDGGRASQHQMITIATTQGVANASVIPCLPGFLSQHQNLNVSLLTYVTERELFESYADIIIWPKIDASRYRFDLKIEPFFSVKFGLFASNSYIDQYGYPKEHKDNHVMIKFFDYNSSPFAESSNHLFKAIAHINIAQEISVNAHSSMINLVNAGAGIGVVSLDSPFVTSQQLIPLFPENTITTDIYLIIRKNLNPSHPSNLFSDYIKSYIQTSLY